MMNNTNAIRTMERMNNIIEEMKQLQNELDALMNSNDLDSYENIPDIRVLNEPYPQKNKKSHPLSLLLQTETESL